MKTLIQYGSTPDRRIIAEAVKALKDGDIILYPTDTLYALGCDATNNKAVERLCRLKKLNPDKNTLSIVCSSLKQASSYVRIDNRAFAVLKEYLPGPFTFVLPAANTLSKAFKGRRQAGIRIPDCDIARVIAEELGNPLMSSSATVNNDDDEVIYADAVAHAYESTPEVTLAVLAGDTGSQPSTVVDISDAADPVILRQGKGQYCM